MQLVIDIPEKIYESSKRECEENDALIVDTFTLAIGNGIPLSKGHGRLGDLDKLEVLMKDEVVNHGTNEYGCISLVHRASTIIEADRAESE